MLEVSEVTHNSDIREYSSTFDNSVNTNDETGVWGEGDIEIHPTKEDLLVREGSSTNDEWT